MRRTIALTLTLVLVVALSWAASPMAAMTKPLARPTRATVVDVERRIDDNLVNLFVTNVGSIGHDFATNGPGLFYPNGYSKTVLYAGGLWVGAMVGGEPRVTGTYYDPEWSPGAIEGGVPQSPSSPDARVLKVLPWRSGAADTAHLTRVASPYQDPLAHHGWSEYLADAAPHGAPTRLHSLPVATTPDPRDSVQVLGPDVRGDMMLWSVFNDADPAGHVNFSTAPLGLEVRQTTWSVQTHCSMPRCSSSTN